MHYLMDTKLSSLNNYIFSASLDRQGLVSLTMALGKYWGQMGDNPRLEMLRDVQSLCTSWAISDNGELPTSPMVLLFCLRLPLTL